jgi:hypothetical protein
MGLEWYERIKGSLARSYPDIKTLPTIKGTERCDLLTQEDTVREYQRNVFPNSSFQG